MQNGLSSALASAASRTRYRAAPEAVRERIAFLLTDVVSTMVSGAARRDVTAMRRLAGAGTGYSTLVGEGRGVPAAPAAYCNALGVAAEQLQEGHRLARGHPASHIVPVVLALAEENNTESEALLSALLAGYEVGVRIGAAMGGTRPGVHDIGTWAQIGAAVAGTHLASGGDANAIEAAIQIASTSPQAFDAATVFAGDGASHLALGAACQSAVMTTYAVQAGLRAEPDAFERHWLPNSAAAFDSRVIAESLDVVGDWKEYWSSEGYIKIHPACAHLNGAIDAALQLGAQWEIEPDDVTDVLVSTYTGAAAFNVRDPSGDLEARFSLPYLVATSLVHGRLDHSSLDEGELTDSQAGALARRVRIEATPEMDEGYPSGRPARVEVHLSTGDVLSAERSLPRGDGAGALEDPEVRAKPYNLLSASAGKEIADRLTQAAADLAHGGPLRPICAELRRIHFG